MTKPASTQSPRSKDEREPASVTTRLTRWAPCGSFTSNGHGSWEIRRMGLSAASSPSMNTLNCTLACIAQNRPFSAFRSTPSSTPARATKRSNSGFNSYISLAGARMPRPFLNARPRMLSGALS